MSSSTPTAPEAVGEAEPMRRGQLRVLLGYAAGVGKTFRMLEEAQQLKRQGKDIVVGYFEPHGRKDTIAKTVGLEMIPTKKINYRNCDFPEMDTDAILRRNPQICVVDELAHTNVPGSQRAKRWEDVQVLLDAGIDVITNMNIQHLESLNDHIFNISGVRVRETVPDWFVKSADEVVMVDATTGALLNRLKRGDIYAPEKAQQAMENFFKESTLAALRELALRQTAHELEFREIAEMPESEEAVSPASSQHEKSIRDRILIYVTADPSAAMLIRRGRRMADYLNADCFAVCVLAQRDGRSWVTQDIEALQKHLNFARNLHIESRILEGRDVAETIVDFAHRNQVTQILLGRPKKQNVLNRLLFTDRVMRIVQKAKDIRVIIVADRRQRQPAPA
ncbi:MAG TPA: sensor histidine kinase KdpD [Terriglobales bacterium]|nr:sensor histidine kinase KdpD [Terriglobales bacterium]